MGCRDRESNVQTFVYSDQQWWCQSGTLMNFIAPSRVILEEGIKRFSSEPLDWWVIEQDPTTRQWTAQQPADSKYR